MTSRDEYIRKMHEKLDELNAEIDLLTSKADKATAEFKKEYRVQIESLKVKHSVVREKLEGLQHAGGNAWEDMKSGIDLAWTAMAEALDSARSRFK